MTLLMPTMMIMGVLGGAASSGFNAYKQHQEITRNICNIAQQMKNYQDSINSTYSTVVADITSVESKLVSASNQIAMLQGLLATKITNFKKSYNNTVFMGILFLIIIAFMLGTKRFLLKPK